MVSTKIDLCGIEIDNPVIPASGTFGYGKEFSELYDINMLGTFSFKGTTKDARFGNPTPRIAETASGMLNCVGLQNPGVDHVIANELPEMNWNLPSRSLLISSAFFAADVASDEPATKSPASPRTRASCSMDFRIRF